MADGYIYTLRATYADLLKNLIESNPPTPAVAKAAVEIGHFLLATIEVQAKYGPLPATKEDADVG